MIRLEISLYKEAKSGKLKFQIRSTNPRNVIRKVKQANY